MPTTERVRDVLQRVLGIPTSSPVGRVPLEELAAVDSLALAELAAGLDEEFGIEIPGDELTTGLSVPDLVTLVDAELRTGPRAG